MRFEKYIRKPVEVDAVQFMGMPLDCLRYDSRVVVDFEREVAHVDTPEGNQSANVNDWIVRGPMGELNIVKADEFPATHDAWEPCPRPRPRKNSSEVDNG